VVALPPDAEWWALAIALAAREVWARAPPPPLSLFFPRGVPPDVAAASKRMAHRALVRPRARTPERPHARAPRPARSRRSRLSRAARRAQNLFARFEARHERQAARRARVVGKREGDA